MPESCPKRSDVRNKRAKVQLATLAARQWGVVTQRQLLELGMGRTTVLRWQRESRLHRLYPGVYAVGHGGLAIEGMLAAALFYAGRGAAASHVTGAWGWEMLKAPPTRFDVSTPWKRRSLPTVQIHRRQNVERIMHKGFPLVPPAQVLLDMASQDCDVDVLRKALAEAEHRKLVTLEEVAAVLGRGKPGSALLGVALRRHLPQLARTRSALEEEFVLLVEGHSLTQPEYNVPVAGWLVDAVWRDLKVVVELDGRSAHSTARNIENDHRRDLALRAAGFRVLRYTWRQVTEEPELVVADLRRHGIS